MTLIDGHTIAKTRNMVLKAMLGACLLLPISQLASAQSNDEQDRPMRATAQPLAGLDNAVSDDIAPVSLSPNAIRETSPLTVRALRATRRNSWDRDTLTQTMGARIAPMPDYVQDDLPRFNQSQADVQHFGTGVSGFNEHDNITAVPLREDGVINLDAPLRGALFGAPTSDNPNMSVFNLNMGGGLCLGRALECVDNLDGVHSLDFGYAKNITHGKRNGFNLQLTPRAGLRFDNESQSAVVGALVRIGDNLRGTSEMKSNAWYLFAGADAEAISYSPNSARRLTSGQFHLQDQIFVGDAQAGLGYRMGSADLAFTYFRRQAKADNYRYDEDAAALSITWKH